MRLVSGYGDLIKAGGRAGLMLTAIERKQHSESKLPLPSVIIEWIYENVGVGSSTATVQKVWNGLVVGFCFLLRGSEMARIRRNDVKLGKDKKVEYLAIFIASSKTDQREVGVSRSLYQSDSVLRPAKNMQKWYEQSNLEPDSDTPLFGHATLEKLRIAIKWAAMANNLPTDRFPLHSMRIGGATCLFFHGISLGGIRKYGRWRTTSPNIYLYFDDVVFSGLGKLCCGGRSTQTTSDSGREGSISKDIIQVCESATTRFARLR